MLEFTSADIDLLREIPALPASLRRKLESNDGRPASLTDDEHQLLLKAVADHLVAYGFDLDYRPTPLGNALEDIITRLTANQDD